MTQPSCQCDCRIKNADLVSIRAVTLYRTLDNALHTSLVATAPDLLDTLTDVVRTIMSGIMDEVQRLCSAAYNVHLAIP